MTFQRAVGLTPDEALGLGIAIAIIAVIVYLARRARQRQLADSTDPAIVGLSAAPVLGYEAGIHCATCGRQTLHHRPKPNHILHAILSIFACGLWLPVWFLATNAAQKQPMRCSTCGTLQPT